MATTTNYGWETADDTDLVKDGALAMRTLGSAIDTTTKALNPSTTLGDIEYRSATANTNTRLAVGTTGQVLTVAGGVPSWATAASGSLTKISTTTFTGITSSSITGCFSATYNNYLIIASDWVNSSGDSNVTWYLRTGGTNATANYQINGFNNNNSTLSGNSFTGFFNSFFMNNTGKSASVMHVQSPFLTKNTTFQMDNTARQYGSSYRGLHNVDTSYPDLGVIVDANTGSGVVTVYGYSI